MALYSEKELARFWAKVEIDPSPDGCWRWTACVAPTGFGVFRIRNKNIYAHRFAWELMHEAIGPGVYVRNKCRALGAICVRPDHQEMIAADQFRSDLYDATTQRRTCRVCGESKRINAFIQSNKSRYYDPERNICRRCSKERYVVANPDPVKRCRGCQQEKPASAFYKDKRSSTGLASQCIDCCLRGGKERWRAQTPEQRQRENERSKQWREKNHDKAKEIHLRGRLKADFGITPETYNMILENQGHRCAICGAAFTERLRAEVDHSYETGNIRGIICRRCNTAIAALGDSAEGVKRAYDYLELREVFPAAIATGRTKRRAWRAS